jgi:asparagine synthase (glutamine-hydrolysing)
VSGIFGILNLDGAPAAAADLSAMATPLERRGPDRTGVWSHGAAGLGHTLLATTPELALERQPFEHAASGCVITADVRLDNRDELLAALQLTERAAVIADGELIIEVYQAWGEEGVARLLGDFAFAIWDPKRRAMFCARDQFAVRPFYYHHGPGRLFAFASQPRAILAVPRVPYQISEGRVADFLTGELEWIDYTSTFFEGVFRLPPAHAVTVTPEGISMRRYWTLEPGPELRLPSNEAYAEALRAVFTEAVRSRLRATGPVGSMLSGGLDSSSVVAVARELVSAEGRPALPTFSAAGPDPRVCAETRAIQAAMATEGLDPHVVDYTALGSLMPALEDASWDLEEPFDFSMVLPRAMYLSAQQNGVRVLLDGIAGDTVLSDGSYTIRLMQQGHWITALREVYALHANFGNHPVWAHTLRRVRIALTPHIARRLHHHLTEPRRADSRVRRSLMTADLARRVSLDDRLRTLDQTTRGRLGWVPDYHRERAAAVHPQLTAGRERYDRVASAWAVEPRDPFSDRRVVEFCVTLPGSQRLQAGWTKVIMRRAMAGRMPDTVRWRRGRSHLGVSFTRAVLEPRCSALRSQPDSIWKPLEPFVDRQKFLASWQKYFGEGDERHRERVQQAASLAQWLTHHQRGGHCSHRGLVL